MLCISLHLDNVAYEIRWYHGSHLWRSDSFILLASIDRLGVVRKSPRNDTSDCSLERLRTQTFTLTIHGTQDSDAGEYYCTATPWIRSTTTEDWSKEPEIISRSVFLNVKFACELYYNVKAWFFTTQIFCFDKAYLQKPTLFGTGVTNINLHLILLFFFSVGFNEVTLALWDLYIPHYRSVFCHSGPSLFFVLL